MAFSCVCVTSSLLYIYVGLCEMCAFVCVRIFWGIHFITLKKEKEKRKKRQLNRPRKYTNTMTTKFRNLTTENERQNNSFWWKRIELPTKWIERRNNVEYAKIKSNENCLINTKWFTWFVKNLFDSFTNLRFV